jgi:SHS2 domain-containing protein
MSDVSHFSEYEFLEHEADIGVRASGDCWECAFKAGAVGLLEVMADPSAVKGTAERKVSLSAGDVGALFVSWLNEILYLRDAEEMLFSSCEISIARRSGDELELRAALKGEKLDPKRHGLKTEVKAATYSGLRYEEAGGRCAVQCLLDL